MNYDKFENFVLAKSPRRIFLLWIKSFIVPHIISYSFAPEPFMNYDKFENFVLAKSPRRKFLLWIISFIVPHIISYSFAPEPFMNYDKFENFVLAKSPRRKFLLWIKSFIVPHIFFLILLLQSHLWITINSRIWRMKGGRTEEFEWCDRFEITAVRKVSPENFSSSETAILLHHQRVIHRPRL